MLCCLWKESRRANLEVRNAELYEYRCPNAQKNGNSDRIAVLFFLCYDERREDTEGLSALLDDDWQTDKSKFAEEQI